MTQELDDTIDFDMSATEEASFDVVPNGTYQATIKAISVVPTRANDGGKRLKMQWAIEDGPHRGRIIFDDHNIFLPGKDTATLNGQRDVKNRYAALGIPGARSYSEAVGLSALIKVKVETDDYGERNKIVTAKPIGGQTAGPQSRAPSTAAPAAAAPARKKPSFV